MDVLFLIVALVGAVMAFGTTLLRLFLEGVALINFVSAEDVIVYGVMLLLALANVGLWMYTTRRSKRVATARTVSMISIIVIVLAYLVLMMSIWADAWLKSYVAWCTQCSTMLTVLAVIGGLMMMAGLGWFGHKLYIAITSKGAHAAEHVRELPQHNAAETNHAGNPVTPANHADADHTGRNGWLNQLEELGFGDDENGDAEGGSVNPPESGTKKSETMAGHPVSSESAEATQVEGESGN